LLIGFLATGSVALPANLFLQPVLSVGIFRIANYSWLFLITFTTYSILRYRLMDIRVVIRRSTVYLISSFFTLCFGLLLWLLLTEYLLLSSIVSLSLILLGSAVIFGWAQNLLQAITNRYFFSSLR